MIEVWYMESESAYYNIELCPKKIKRHIQPTNNACTFWIGEVGIPSLCEVES